VLYAHCLLGATRWCAWWCATVLIGATWWCAWWCAWLCATVLIGGDMMVCRPLPPNHLNPTHKPLTLSIIFSCRVGPNRTWDFHIL